MKTSLSKRLSGDTVLRCRHEIVAEINYPDPALRGFQGGCSDGKRYYYQIAMHYDLPDRLRLAVCSVVCIDDMITLFGVLRHVCLTYAETRGFVAYFYATHREFV